MLLSAALSACPASDRPTKAATATETAAGLVAGIKPFDRHHRTPAGSAAKPFDHARAPFWNTSLFIFLIFITIELKAQSIPTFVLKTHTLCSNQEKKPAPLEL